ncbi:MAG: hypothetical protein VW491_07320, partial [Gammaproteobacteria bacterium]
MHRLLLSDDVGELGGRVPVRALAAVCVEGTHVRVVARVVRAGVSCRAKVRVHVPDVGVHGRAVVFLSGPKLEPHHNRGSKYWPIKNLPGGG